MFTNKSIVQLNKERTQLQTNLQNNFNLQSSYEEKLCQIYNIIVKSQEPYQRYKMNKFFMELSLEDLCSQLNSIKDLNDIKFYIFIYNKLITPLESGHISIKFENKYFNYLVEIYGLLQEKSKINKELRTFLQNNPLEMLLEQLADFQDLNDTTFYDFIDTCFRSIYPKEKILNPKKENMSFKLIGNTAVITILSFSKKNLQNDISKFEQLEKILIAGAYENIVIDIRGNMGGTDEYFKYFSILSNTDIVNCVKWRNLFTNENEAFFERCITKGTDKKYRIYLLVDSKVFSTAEAFTQLCKKTHFATVVGERTSGEGAGMTPICININTKAPIILRFPIEAPINDNGEIDYENAYSTIPDIQVESTNALEVTLKTIEDHKLNIQNFQNNRQPDL